MYNKCYKEVICVQRPKGTLDVYGLEGKLYDYLYEYTSNFMKLYNYDFIKLPTFEYTELFYRGVGSTTDVVNKETYDFVDKGGRNITLRPEFTAGVVRSYIENKLYVDGVSKFYYFGSAFRYERPQSGRLREFTQFGVEAFGIKNPYFDAEIINLAYKYLSGLNITDLKVYINTLGDNESRDNYNKVIKEYLEKDYDNLCDTCKERLNKNPLRILDCKYDSDREYIKNAPKIIDYINGESKEYYEKVKEALTLLDIPFEEDKTLVRGLDYYSHTVFEIKSNLEFLGKANTLLAGGRYDTLVETLGGPGTPAMGFAAGIERIMTVLAELEAYVPTNEVDIFVMNLSGNAYAYQIVDDLRNSGFIVETDYTGKSIKGLWKLVDKFNPAYILIVGEDEEMGSYVTVKCASTKEEVKVKASELLEYLDMNI